MRDQVIEILKEVAPRFDVNSTERLVDDKVLDSLSIVSLVAELSLSFGVKFNVADLAPENFNSVDLIVGTIKRLQAGM